MSFSGVHKAIYAILSNSSETYVGIRAAGAPIPCFVYEITSATLDVPMAGVLGKNHWTMDVEVIAIGNTVEEITGLVDDVEAFFSSGPINDLVNTLSIVLAGFSVVMGMEPADDGMQDVTRTATIQLHLLVQED